MEKLQGPKLRIAVERIVVEIDFAPSPWYIRKKIVTFRLPMKKGKRFINLKLGKQMTRRPKPLAAQSKKKLKIGRVS
jgi:hypothetical protein